MTCTRRVLVVCTLVLTAACGPRRGDTTAAGGPPASPLAGSTVRFWMERQRQDLQQVIGQKDSVARDGEVVRLSLAGDALFGPGGAQLRTGGEQKLRAVALVLGTYPRTGLEVVAHADGRGTGAGRQALAEKRAAAVRAALVRHGVDGDRLTTRGEAGGDSRRIEIVARLAAPAETAAPATETD